MSKRKGWDTMAHKRKEAIPPERLERKKAYNRERGRKFRAALRDAQLCIRCGKEPVADGYFTCQTCRDYKRDWSGKYKEKWEHMTKEEIIKTLKEKADLPNLKLAQDVYGVFLEILFQGARTKKGLTLHNFGTFKIVDRAPRTAYSPLKKETVILPACKAMTFKQAKALKDRINGC